MKIRLLCDVVAYGVKYPKGSTQNVCRKPTSTGSTRFAIPGRRGFKIVWDQYVIVRIRLNCDLNLPSHPELVEGSVLTPIYVHDADTEIGEYVEAANGQQIFIDKSDFEYV